MLRITRNLAIDESEIAEEFVRAPGPGGQNVNKVSTAVQLRFDAANSPNLSDEIRARLKTLAGRRMTADGVLILQARRYRTRERNREDARDRLVALLRKAAQRPKKRIATKPTAASRRRRLADKKRRSETKRLRRRPGRGEE